MPKVSFVIPVYDGDSYLAETIESIRNQTMKDIEIIVIDDCSPDFTPELMVWFQKQDPRIKYERLDVNGGVCEARNFGNRKAESELICVNDQDDLSSPIRAMFSYEYMKRRPQVNCLTSAYRECNVDGIPIKTYVPDNMTRELFESGRMVWFHSSACYRKEDILKLPYRNLNNGETDDYRFLGDWLDAGMRFKTTKKILADCRRTPWSVMQQRRASKGLGGSYIL